jgi:dihydrofolate reductase
MLMGRKTYEIYAATWPTREGAYPDLINSMPKYVASTTLASPTWQNTTVLKGDLLPSVQALKDSPGTGILMHGFGPVAKSLAQAGLLDELHLWLNPAFAGVGDDEDLLLSPGLNIGLQHRATRTLSNGVVVVSYAFQAPEWATS